MAELTKEHLKRYHDIETDGTGLEEEANELEIRLERVQSLADTLVEKRKEAMDAKRLCGIEDDWKEDEEFYQSIDSANPEGETNVGKPISADGGPIGIAPGVKQQARSNVFIPLTRPYVDAAAARIADMLLPNDEMPWSIKATPISDQPGMVPPQPLAPVAAAGMPPAAMMGTMGAPQPGAMNTGPVAPATPDMGGATGMSGPVSTPAMMAPGAMNPAQAVMAQPAAVALTGEGTEQTAEEKAAEAATKQITDWLIQCQYHAEFRKMLENAAKLGTGILKGPVPVVRVFRKYVKDPATGEVRLERVQVTEPASFSIDPRNFFPDPACGDDVQRGGYVWEYDTLSGRAVQDLLQDETYIEVQVRKVLKEGPCKQGEAPASSPQTIAAERSLVGSAFGVWYFYGMVERDTLIACGVPEEDLNDGDLANMESIPAIITMINDTVVKAALTPMDSGGFPYDVMPWQRRAGMIWGMGVARQMRTPQRMVNAAARSMMDNAAFTSGPLIGIREEWIKTVAGMNTVSPRTIFRMTTKAPDTAKIGDAITSVNIEANQAEMERIIQLGMKMAEDATGLPMLMQGQQGAAPDTVGGMTILNNNGSTVLRRIARQADDSVTERHIRRYYYWLLENGDNEAAKGDFQIDARGSTALVDRELANQALVQLAPILEQDPDIHKQRFHEELLRAHRIDPKNLYMTDAEKKARDAKPQPPPPQVQAVMLREEHADQRHEKDLALKAVELQGNQKLGEGELQAKWELGLGDLSLKLGISQDQLKSMLAATAMKLNVQQSISNENNVHKTAAQVADAGNEPPGRAKAGEAFEH